MSRNKGRRKKKPNERAKEEPRLGIDQPIPNPRALERTIADITRLLEKQDFESEEEAHAFLEELLEAGPPPPSKPNTPLEKAQDLVYKA